MKLLPLAAALVLLVPAAPVLAAEDPVINVEAGDPAMVAAQAKARASLPKFWAERANPKAGEHDFSLKLGITEGDYTEHFWCDQIEGDATAATCAIANEPAEVHTVAYGQRVKVDPEAISDWMYYFGDKIVGGETIRALLPHMSAEEAAAFRAMLVE